VKQTLGIERRKFKFGYSWDAGSWCGKRREMFGGSADVVKMYMDLTRNMNRMEIIRRLV
jgi:hypothetical protein